MMHLFLRQAAIVAALVAAPAAAGPLTIAPTTIEMTPQRHSTMLSVTNDSDEPVDLQLRAYAWAQPDGRDVLTPTDDLVVSPAVVTVAPHARQVFRILRAATAASATEASYRLKLDQLPRPGVTGVSIDLQFSLPVFVSAAGAAPHLRWTREGEGVTITNAGARRVRFATLSLAGAGMRAPLAGGASPYLLAGATRRYALPAAAARIGAAPRLVATTDSGTIEVAGDALADR